MENVLEMSQSEMFRIIHILATRMVRDFLNNITISH